MLGTSPFRHGRPPESIRMYLIKNTVPITPAPVAPTKIPTDSIVRAMNAIKTAWPRNMIVQRPHARRTSLQFSISFALDEVLIDRSRHAKKIVNTTKNQKRLSSSFIGILVARAGRFINRNSHRNRRSPPAAQARHIQIRVRQRMNLSRFGGPACRSWQSRKSPRASLARRRLAYHRRLG